VEFRVSRQATKARYTPLPAHSRGLRRADRLLWYEGLAQACRTHVATPNGAIFQAMPLDTKRMTDLVETDILELISNGIEEGREIDYKQTLKIGSDGDKKEFLADVSSFGNASGGHLIFGVAETDGRPMEIKPLTIPNSDAERLKIESLVRDGISPRLAIELIVIPVNPSGHVLVLRIPRSWAGPHMVNLQHNSKFFSRNSAGKYQLDVGELRSAFTSGAQVGELIRSFRQNRLSAVVSGETPVRLPDTPKLVLHCYPYTSTILGTSIDIQKAHRQTSLVRPMYGGGYSPGFNFDGIISYAPDSSTPELGYSYFQLFRDGKVECVEARLLRPRGELGKMVPSLALEAACICAVARVFTLFHWLEVKPPAAIMLTLIGVKSYRMGLDPMAAYAGSEIDRDALIFPPQIAESFNPDEVAVFMRSTFDSLWNATGLSGCGDYDMAGNPSKELQKQIQNMG